MTFDVLVVNCNCSALKGYIFFSTVATTLKVRCECCFVNLTGSAVLMGDTFNFTFGVGNCFNLASADDSKLSGGVFEDEASCTFGVDSCSGCYGRCEEVRDIPAWMDLTVEDCEWVNKTAAVLNFLGENLRMIRCRFIECGSSQADGGCVYANSFSGDLYFKDLKIEKCIGRKGSIAFDTSLAKTVTFFECSFVESDYAKSTDSATGCISGVGGGRLLNVIVIESNFSGCSVSGGTGVISSGHSNLYVENVIFEDCKITDNSDETFGSFIYQKSDNVNASVIGCTFENNEVIAGTVSSIFVENIGGGSSFVFRDSVFHWRCPSSSSSSPIEAKAISTATIVNVNVRFSGSSDSADPCIFELSGVGNLELVSCNIQSFDPDPSRRVAFNGGGKVVATKCEFYALLGGAWMTVDSELKVYECRFTEIRSYGICTVNNVISNIIIFDSYFGETSNYQSEFISVGSSSSKVRIDFCCFQTDWFATKKAIQIGGVLTIGAENCFQHKNEEQAIKSEQAIDYNNDACAIYINHFDCKQNCRHVCPTARYSSSNDFTFSKKSDLSDYFRPSNSVSESDDIGKTEFIPDTNRQSVSNFASKSKENTISDFTFVDSGKLSPSLYLGKSFKFYDSETFSGSLQGFGGTNRGSKSSGFTSSGSVSSTQRNSVSGNLPKTDDFTSSSRHRESNVFTSSVILSESHALTRSETHVRVEDSSTVVTASTDGSTMTSSTVSSSISEEYLPSVPKSEVGQSLTQSLSDSEAIVLPQGSSIVSQVTTRGVDGESQGAKEGDDSGDMVWLVVCVVVMVAFIATFSYLMYRENEKKRKDIMRKWNNAAAPKK
jgi:hypothetical protein